jgi:hypothetical protein
MDENQHPSYNGLFKDLTKIQAGTNLYNIGSIESSTGSSQHLLEISGSITVPKDAQNLQNAGKKFQIKIEFSQFYPWESPTVYCNGVKVDLIDTIGYHIDLERKGLHDWGVKYWKNPIIGTDLPKYFAGALQIDQNGWVDYVPGRSDLETIFKMMQYMLERTGPPSPSPSTPSPPSSRKILCDIDFTKIPSVSPPDKFAHLDLSEYVDPITLEGYSPGEELYVVQKYLREMDGRVILYTHIYKKEGLQVWLDGNGDDDGATMMDTLPCEHPSLKGVLINQGDIERFIYTGPPYVEKRHGYFFNHSQVIGGSIRKRKSRTFKKNNRKSKNK